MNPVNSVRKLLSLVVITKNEEKNIKRCLLSVPFASEKLVVDSGSSDKTTEIAESFGARVLYHAFENFSAQKKWAVEKAEHDFVLLLDADENLNPEMANEIERICSERTSHKSFDVYRLKRRSFYMGRLLRFGPWLKDRPVRFFHRDSIITGDELVHEKVKTAGKTGVIRKGFIEHRPYESLREHAFRMNTYCALWAEQEYVKDRKASPLHIICRPIWKFIVSYIFYGGFLEGVPGFTASFSSSVYVFWKWSMLYEKQKRKNRAE